MRGATGEQYATTSYVDISTHAPRTGSDVVILELSSSTTPFQPTLPARGATRRSRPTESSSIISTHAPRTGSDNQPFFFVGVTSRFQPTLPARGATMASRASRSSELFQPTLPARGATKFKRPHVYYHVISTHAPRTGSDLLFWNCQVLPLHFNPRSPHGERRCRLDCGWCVTIFQPTLPARGATAFGRKMSQWHSISTHAPRTGSDV